MVARDCRPGSPPDGTVRADRRSRDPFRPAPPRPADRCLRCRAAPRGRPTVKRLELAGWAGYGYCAARTRWYWGLKLYLVTAPDGMPAAWCPASPKPGEREVARDLLAHAARSGALRPGFTPSATRALHGGTSSIWSLPGQGCTWSVRTGGTRRPGTGPSAGFGSGSYRSTTPSRASSTSNATAAAPPRASTSGSPSGCWPWLRASGTTGPPANPSSGR